MTMYIQTQKATYQLNMSEPSSSQCTEKTYDEINNTPSFTLATLKIMHADTSQWLLAAKFYMPGNFYNAV